MKNHYKSLIFILLAATLLSVAGCSKFRENRQFDTVYDNDVAEGAYNDMFRLACQYADYGSSLASDPCYNRPAISDTVFPKTYTFAFRDTTPPCADLYEIRRTGGLTIMYSADFNTEGATATVTPGSDYRFEGYKVGGSLVITYTGLVDGHKKYTLAVDAATLSTDNGQSVSWTCNRTFTQDEDPSSLVFDDIYRITGTASGVDREGRAFEVAITDYLEKEQSCRWNRSGSVTISPADIDEKEVNYGADCSGVGCCDNEVRVKTGGKRETSINL